MAVVDKSRNRLFLCRPRNKTVLRTTCNTLTSRKLAHKANGRAHATIVVSLVTLRSTCVCPRIVSKPTRITRSLR